MRAVLRSEVEVAAPADQVWAYVTDWSRQGEWIPLTRVESTNGRQLGGQIRAWTGLGPIGFWDTMTITSWDPLLDGAARCEVLHTGVVVRGDGQFSVHSAGPARSTFMWSEDLEVPGGRAGAVVWKLVGPLVRRGGDRALREMAAQAEKAYAGR